MSAEKAKKNPLFEANLAQLQQFPLFWEFAQVPNSREQMEAQAQAMAKQGQVPTKVAASEPDSLPGTTSNKIRK